MMVARISAPMVGEIFQERYRIVSEIGAGGFGTVYKGEQLATGQAVAIKMLRLVGARDPKAIEKRIARLEREMRLCAQLHHPNIVGLIDFGRTSDGGVYSVFELIPGRNLEEVLLDEGALEPQEARHLMLEVLDALSCAHGQGVIHRDLKPSNIMVTATGARRNALVLDFGIGALLADGHGVESTRLTATNEVVGTIAYAAPEQLLSRPTSPSSDLYSWGLVFLECLMGAPAIQATSLMDMLLKQVGAEIVLPPALEKHELGRILRSVVSKRGEDRAASAAVILRRLEACSVADLRRDTMKRPDEPAVSTPDSPSLTSARSAQPTPPQALVTLQVDAPPREPQAVTLREGQGTAIAAATGEAAAPAPAERRQVTVVCVTFCASDPSIEGDFEESDDELRRGLERCTAIAERAGGVLVGGLGDQVLFRFGFPAAGEDDARRAARAAREMIAAEGRGAVAGGAGSKGLRIGVHTGLTIAQAHEPSAAPAKAASLGVTPALAAHLSRSAAMGEILASASAQRLLRNHFKLEARSAPAIAPGSPVDAYRLGLPLDVTRAMSIAEAGPPALIGRDREIDLLMTRWAEVEGGQGQVVLMTGEAGIGKSRLIHELAARLHGRPHRWVESRSVREERNRALHPIIDILERLLDLGEGEGPPARRAKLESLLRGLDFDLADAMSLISELLGLPPAPGEAPARPERSPQQAKELLLNALLSLFFELSEREPLVLVVEDLQWADPTTLELLSSIVQEAGSSRVLVIFSARPSFAPPWSLSRVLQMALPRLRREEIREMVALLAGTGEPPPSSVLEQIVDRTDGVPLFVEELTRVLLEAGFLPLFGAASVRPSFTAEVPASLRDLLTARLDRLGRAKGTAQIAAALGREIGHELLAAVSPLGEVQLREDLDALVGADLMQRKRRSRGHTYAFKHALVRDTAYESMLRGARQKVHAEIVRAIEERFPDMMTARPDLVAAHCAEAGRKQDAVRHVVRAAEVSLHRAAFAEAIGYAQQGITWLDAVEAGQDRALLDVQLHTVLVNAFFSLKGPGAAEADAGIAHVEALLPEVADSPVAIPMLARIALRAQLRGQFAHSTELASRCLALGERAQDSGARISALAILAQNLLCTGRPAEACAAAELALTLYDPRVHASAAITTSGLDFSAVCHGVLGLGLWFLGHPDQALAEVKQGLERMERLDHPNSTAMSLLYVGSLHRYRRETGAMTAAFARLQEISQRHNLYLGAFSGILLSSLAGDTGTATQILGMFRMLGQVFALPYWLSVVAEAHAVAGRRAAALEQIDECIRESGATGETYYLPELLRLQGTFLLVPQAEREASASPASSPFEDASPADREAAESCFRQALALAGEQGSRMCALRASTSLASLLVATDRAAEARTLLDRALATTTTEGADLADLREARELAGRLHDEGAGALPA